MRLIVSPAEIISPRDNGISANPQINCASVSEASVRLYPQKPIRNPPRPTPSSSEISSLSICIYIGGGRLRGVAGGWFACILNLISTRLFIIPFRSRIVGRFCISPRHPCIVCGCGLNVFVCTISILRHYCFYVKSLRYYFEYCFFNMFSH